MFCLLFAIDDEISDAQEMACCGKPVPNGFKSKWQWDAAGPPFTSLINTKQLNNALWGIVNKRPKADYLKGEVGLWRLAPLIQFPPIKTFKKMH